VIRPLIGAGSDRMAAFVVTAIDQDAANACLEVGLSGRSSFGMSSFTNALLIRRYDGRSFFAIRVAVNLRSRAFRASQTALYCPLRRATATPNKKAMRSEPRGASRAMLLKMLNGIPGLRPASIAPLTRRAVPFAASETSAIVDLGSATGSRPS
jgi:hypothetical protein